MDDKEYVVIPLIIPKETIEKAYIELFKLAMPRYLEERRKQKKSQ